MRDSLPLRKYNVAKDCQKQAKERTLWSSLDLTCHSWSPCSLSTDPSSRSTHVLYQEQRSLLLWNAFLSQTAGRRKHYRLKLELVKHLTKAQLAATKPAFVTLRPNDSSVGIVPHPPISSMLELGSGPSDGGNLVQFLTEDFDSTAWQKTLLQH